MPVFDNQAKNYREFRRRCEVYKQKMDLVLAGRGKETIFNLITLLYGRSWDLVEDLDVQQLSDNGFQKVFDRLDKAFQFDPLTELPSDFEKFFISLSRRTGQTLQDYTQEFTHAERRLRTIHKVDLPEKVKAWYFLRRSGLSKEQRLMVLSSVGHETLDLDNVQKTMNFVIGQDTKLEGQRWTRSKDSVMYNDETATSTPWQDDESWDYMATADGAYYEDDYEQWVDYDAGYFDDNDTAHGDEQDSEVFDVDEYDAIYANFVEARSKMNQMRVNRGFYPVVALIDSSGKGGSNRSKSKGKQKGKGKPKGRGSSPPQKGGAKARGRAVFGQGRQICVRCGQSGHQARNCPSQGDRKRKIEEQEELVGREHRYCRALKHRPGA